MSHWISVFCQNPITRFSASLLEREIRRGCKDYRGHNYFDDLFEFVHVKQYLAPKKEPGRSLFHVTYQVKNAHRKADKVPIVLDRIVNPSEIQGIVREQLEDYLKSRKGLKAALVRHHLARVVEIYSFCLKQIHCDEEGSILVSVAREFLASKGKGMVREDGVGWLKWTRHGLFEALKPP